MLELSKDDLSVIRSMRQGKRESDRVLQKVRGKKMDPAGVILITCSDCDQFPDIFIHKTKVLKRCGCKNPRIHTFAWNGGALRLIPDSPANRRGRSFAIDLMDEIRDAMEMKELKNIALYIHSPCGKALSVKLNFYQTLVVLLQAKQRLENKIPEADVACFCQVYYGRGKRNTYFVSRENFGKWNSQNSYLR